MANFYNQIISSLRLYTFLVLHFWLDLFMDELQLQVTINSLYDLKLKTIQFNS